MKTKPINIMLSENMIDTMEFLCWVNRCTFPADLRDDFIRYGMDEGEAYAFYHFSLTERMEQKGEIDIMWLYQSYCINKNNAFRTYILKYIEEYYNKWLSYKEKKS